MEQKEVKKTKPKKSSFWTGVKKEWGKITWTSKQDLAKQTVAVLIVSVITTFLITLIDSGALAIIEKIM